MFRHIDEFETLRNQTTVLSEGEDRRFCKAGYNVLDISLSEDEIIGKILKIRLVSRYEDNDLNCGKRVRSLFHLRPARIFIFKTCPNLIREIKSYRYAEGDRPRKVDDHALDELRYYVMSKPRPKEETITSSNSPIARDKRRLVRELNRTRGGRKR